MPLDGESKKGGDGKDKGGAYSTKTIQILSNLHNLTVAKIDAVSDQDARDCQENLAGLCVLARKPAAKSIILRSITKVLLSVFSKYRFSSLTLQSACDLVWSLAYHDASVQQAFSESGLSAAVFECTKRHPTHSALLKSGFGAVSSLCRHRQNQFIAFRSNLVPFLLQILSSDNFDDITLLQYTLDASASVCHANEENGRLFLESGGVVSVVSALQNHLKNTSIVRSACIVLVVLRDRQGGPAKIVDAGVLKVLMPAVQQHVNTPELEHILCALLGQLLREVPHVTSQIVEYQGIEAALDCLMANPSHYFIIEAGCLILSGCCSAMLKDTASSTDRQALVDVLSKVKWEGLIAILCQPVASVTKHYVFLSSLKVLSHFCLLTKEFGAKQVLAVSPRFLQAIFRLFAELHGSLIAQYTVVFEAVVRSDTIKSIARGIDVWVSICLSGSTHSKVQDWISAFELVEILSHESQSFLAWAAFPQTLVSLAEMQIIVKGALLRLNTFEKDRKEGRHKTDPFVLEEIHCIFSILAGLLLCREDRKSAPDLLDQESSWAEITTTALTWLRELRSIGQFRIHEDHKRVESICLCTMSSILRFVACTLYKERQLTLRSMAGNGGVTLILQLQKVVKQLDGDTSFGDSSGPSPRESSAKSLKDITLSASSIILKLIGAGNAPAMPVRPIKDVLNSSFAQLSEERKARDQELKRQQEMELLNEDSKERKESETDAQILKATASTPASEINKEENFSGSAEVTTPEGEEENELGDGEDSCNDESDADESDEDTPAVPDFNCEEQTSEETIKLASEEEKARPGWCMPFVRPGNLLAPPRFVAELPELVLDVTKDMVEPCIPNTKRAETVSHSNTGLLRGFGQTGKLVYDWKLSGGEGSGRARANLSPPVVLLPENMEPLQNPQEKSFLLQQPKDWATDGELGNRKEKDHHLYFESRFECGNLYQAFKVDEYEYDLILRSDLHTRSHHQWFYFAVSNTHRTEESGSVEYRFNIVNMSKPSSMFSEGMQPVLYSMSRSEKENVGWRRTGNNINYNANSFPTPANTGKKAGGHYFTLSFSMQFASANDIYLIAMCYPYSYTQLQRFLASVCDADSTEICQRSLLCSSLGGLRCDLLTVTDFCSSASEIASRPAVVLTARVHPGEVVASFMMEGTIKFVLGDSALAKLLRSMFIFKIVPMLNPDGVYHGNSRVSLSGCDLNRTWTKPEPHIFPTIFNTKAMIKDLQNSRKVALFADFHGHSRKKNIFIYGVEYKKQPLNTLASDLYVNTVRQFPRLMAESPYTADIFSYPDCSFTVSKSHASAARVVVARELGVRSSFTIEASFCGGGPGTLNSQLQNKHFNPCHFEQIGLGLCDALLKLTSPKLCTALLSACPNYAEDTVNHGVLNRILTNHQSTAVQTPSSASTSGATSLFATVKRREKQRLQAQQVEKTEKHANTFTALPSPTKHTSSAASLSMFDSGSKSLPTSRSKARRELLTGTSSNVSTKLLELHESASCKTILGTFNLRTGAPETDSDASVEMDDGKKQTQKKSKKPTKLHSNVGLEQQTSRSPSRKGVLDESSWKVAPNASAAPSEFLSALSISSSKRRRSKILPSV